MPPESSISEVVYKSIDELALFAEVRVEDIDTETVRTRFERDEKFLKDMVKSIQRVGILQPLHKLNHLLHFNHQKNDRSFKFITLWYPEVLKCSYTPHYF